MGREQSMDFLHRVASMRALGKLDKSIEVEKGVVRIRYTTFDGVDVLVTTYDPKNGLKVEKNTEILRGL